jgi:hypothetical protein
MARDHVTGTPLSTQAGPAPTDNPASTGQPQTHRPRYLIIVSRDQPDLWRHLRQLLTGVDGVDVVLDRRHGGRWQWSQSLEYQERGADRRRPSNPEMGFSQRSFVIVDPAGSHVTRPLGPLA